MAGISPQEVRSLPQSSTFDQVLTQLHAIDPAALRFFRGIEKEGLRVNENSEISQEKHGQELGSALTHPHITTDYSEALLEFISPVSDHPQAVLNFLAQAHQFTYQQLNNEQIWPASMPGVIDDELDVPIAEYGASHIGHLKHVYRRGLWHRYGRKMQCIAGLHYNFSVPEELWQALANIQGKTCTQDYISEGYFGLIRNFRRYSWLLLYLFGASPALDKSFLIDKQHDLQKKDEDTYYLPYATSLRMSGLGYQNNAQEGLFVCFNGLPTYTKTLKGAMAQSVPAYEKIGVEQDGEFKQLNTHLLQIENEYYSDVRPKRNSRDGEKPLTALNRHGVEYIEVRCLDLNPFLPLGIDLEQSYFMDLFLAYCLLADSPFLSDAECKEVVANQRSVVLEGRRPGFELQRHNEPVLLQRWGEELLQAMQPLAQLLDEKSGQGMYQDALNAMLKRVQDPALTPSAKVLAAMDENEQSFVEFALKQAQLHSETYQVKLSQKDQDQWLRFAEESLEKQRDMEANDTGTFAQFLKEYLVKV